MLHPAVLNFSRGLLVLPGVLMGSPRAPESPRKGGELSRLGSFPTSVSKMVGVGAGGVLTTEPEDMGQEP